MRAQRAGRLVSAGCSWAQGTHQVAQKLITAGRPRRLPSETGGPPPTGVRLKGGAACPTRGEGTECGSRPRFKTSTARKGTATSRPAARTFRFNASFPAPSPGP